MLRISSRLLCVLVLVGICGGVGGAQRLRLIKDVNDTPIYQSSDPESFVSLGNRSLFFAFGSVWETDGTTAGTSKVFDTPSGYSSWFRLPIRVGGQIAFFAETGGTSELWTTDGTPNGWARVMSLPAKPSEVAVIGARLFLGMVSGLYVSDLTANGLLWLAPVQSGADQLRVVGTSLYFRGAVSGSTRMMWKSDGTVAGTGLIQPLATAATGVDHLTVLGNRVFFSGFQRSSGLELWQTDGTVTGTQIVLDLIPGSTGASPRELAAMGTSLFFVAQATSSTQRVIYRTDGSAAGTLPVTTSGNGHPSITDLRTVGGRVYFLGLASLGTEVYETTAAAPGYRLVRDIRPGAVGSQPEFQTAWNQILFLTATGSTGRELWSIDSANSTCDLVRDVVPGSGSAAFGSFHLHPGGGILYGCDDGKNGMEPWISDGTPSGTQLLKDLGQATESGNVDGLLGAFGRVFFLANDREVWVTDGTAVGTERLIAPVPVNRNETFRLQSQGIVGDRLFLVAADHAFYVTDGSVAGTRKLKDFRGAYDLHRRAATRDRIVFFVSYLSRQELWSSDGTVSGTVMLRSFGQRFYGGVLCSMGGRVYFGTRAGELWVTDGTAASTQVLASGFVGSVSSPVALGDEVFFSANDGVHGTEPWITDGTGAGTRLVADLVPGVFGSSFLPICVVDGKLIANVDRTDYELWESDGTAAGTQYVTERPESREVVGGFPVAGGFFTNHSNTWWTDGDEPFFFNLEAGTFWRMGDFTPGARASSWTAFSVGGSTAMLVGQLGEDSVWLCDGTTAGTRRLMNLTPNSLAYFGSSAMLHGRLIAGVWNKDIGLELFAIEEIASTQMVGAPQRTGPELRATRPELGQPLALSVRDDGGSARSGVLIFGAPAYTVVQPSVLEFYVDLGQPTQSLPVVTSPGGFWRLNLMIPNDPNLKGIVVAAQAGLRPAPGAPSGLDLTNGLRIVPW